MTSEDGPAVAPAHLRQQARAHWSRGEMATALDAAWAAFSADADDHESKVLLSWLLLWTPQHVRPEHETALLSLAQDPRIDPDSVSRAGWTLVLGRAHGGAEDDESAARFLERDELAGVLLRESPVLHEDAELRLTAVRRWLLRNRAWARFPRLADDLIEQARLNGGAWGWEADERALLDRPESRPLIPAYWPRGAPQAGGACADDVARAVAAQYERWPYPRWRRVTVRGPMAPLDGPDERAPLRAGARILVAGCGTGGEAAMVAMNNPGAEVVGIDVSHASLRYAEERRAALAAENAQLNGLGARVRSVTLDAAAPARAFAAAKRNSDAKRELLDALEIAPNFAPAQKLLLELTDSEGKS